MKTDKLISAKFVIFAAISIALGFGCGTAPTHSGFLQDYSKLQVDPEDESLLWYEKKDVDWKRYKKVMIDPVVIYFHKDAKNQQIEPGVLKELTDYFRAMAIEEVEKVCPVVEEPGPDVLRIRAAITELIPASPAVNLITTAGIGLPLDMGGAAMEAEFLDSMTSEPLGAVIDRKEGDINVLKGFTTWGYAKGAFRDWAELLRESLEYTHKE